MIKELTYRAFLNSVNKVNGSWQVEDIHYMGKITIDDNTANNSALLKDKIKAIFRLDANADIKLFYCNDDKLIIVDYCIATNECTPLGHLSLVEEIIKY